MMQMFGPRGEKLSKCSEADAERLVKVEKTAEYFTTKGNRKRQAIRLLPPPPPPSDSRNSATTITLTEMDANAGGCGSRGYQAFARAKVQQFAIPSWSDRVRFCGAL